MATNWTDATLFAEIDVVLPAILEAAETTYYQAYVKNFQKKNKKKLRLSKKLICKNTHSPKAIPVL